MNKIRIAIVGCGSMANAHAGIYGNMDNVEIVACCDIIENMAKEFAEKYNIPKYYTDYRKMFDTEKPDGVSVVTNDRYHKEVSMAALERNIHTLCEKPLSDNLQDAKDMADLAEEKLKEGIFTAVNFSYRNAPATQKLAEMVHSGEYGRVITFEAHYKQSWIPAHYAGLYYETPRLAWRMSTKHGTLGTLGDVGVHIYDLTRFVCGDFDELFCQLDCYDKEVNEYGEYVFDANETMFTIAKLKCGGRGTVDASRWATGFKNEVSIYVECEKAGFYLNLDRMQGGQLTACRGANTDNAAWEVIPCPQTPNNHERFIASIIEKKQGQTSFAVAYEVQKILDSSMKSNTKQGYVKL